jgi:hypothetical protein
VKRADGHADIVRLKSASQNTVVPQVGQKWLVFELSPLLAIADINVVRSFGANVFFLEVRADTEYRPGSPLTLAAVARDDGIGISRYFDTQGATGAMCVSRHTFPPYQVRRNHCELRLTAGRQG